MAHGAERGAGRARGAWRAERGARSVARRAWRAERGAAELEQETRRRTGTILLFGVRVLRVGCVLPVPIPPYMYV